MATWNPWDQTPRGLDDATLQWLLNGGLQKDYESGSRGIRDGFRYQAGNGSPAGNYGGDAGGWQAATPTTQWDRIAVDPQTGQDIGRDYEAYDPTGQFTHSWISGGQTLLDRVAPFIPAVASMVAGMPPGWLDQLLSGGVGTGAGGLENLIMDMGGSPFTVGLPGGELSLAEFGSVLPGASTLTNVLPNVNSMLPGTLTPTGIDGTPITPGGTPTTPGGTSGSGSGTTPGGKVPGGTGSGDGKTPTWQDIIAMLAGAAAGAAGSKDQTITQAPWAEAQPWIKQNIGSGQALQKQYQDHPFSSQQQTIYSNLGTMLDALNENTQNWQGFNSANSSGANNYTYGRGLLGAPMPGPQTFAPGLLRLPRGK